MCVSRTNDEFNLFEALFKVRNDFVGVQLSVHLKMDLSSLVGQMWTQYVFSRSVGPSLSLSLSLNTHVDVSGRQEYNCVRG